MLYKQNKDADTKLIKFTDKDPEGLGDTPDVTMYVKFRFDLSWGQIDSIHEAAEYVDYADFPTFADWVEAVIEKARKDDSWKNDTKNRWEFWDPDPCLEIEV